MTCYKAEAMAGVPGGPVLVNIMIMSIQPSSSCRMVKYQYNMDNNLYHLLAWGEFLNDDESILFLIRHYCAMAVCNQG